MKQNTINIKYKVTGGEPTSLQYLGEGNQSNMAACLMVINEITKEGIADWVSCEVHETDGFSFHIQTVYTNGQAMTDFGVPKTLANHPKLFERLAQFQAVFHGNTPDASYSNIH